jgi:hypothetical protein
MRNLILSGALMAASAFFSISANAQAIKTNFAAPLSLYYEQAISDGISVQLGASYDVLSSGITAVSSFDRTAYTSFSIPLEARLYFSEEVGDGLFAGAFVKYRRYAYTLSAPNLFGGEEDFYEYENDKLGIGATFGYQKRFDSGILFDAFLGLGFAPLNTAKYTFTQTYRDFNGNLVTDTDVLNAPTTGIVSRLGVCLGYVIGD